MNLCDKGILKNFRILIFRMNDIRLIFKKSNHQNCLYTSSAIVVRGTSATICLTYSLRSINVPSV
ncbi:Uncharacterized protein dnm_046010 [Desulfonema magnum]|uniref:Uncharacterized protein n=1 Tax=Desulfonema magnum TaxID=45655 RepID=A0A975BP24_9BACT|nr:Uncharacterized protein dnm_046010 [Desulfonema magnum]